MRNGLAAFCVFAYITSIALGQLTPEEAAKRLREKQADRAVAATQPTTLTAGEVDDLKREIELLKAENAGLRKQLAAAAQPTTVAVAKPKPTPRKHYEKIETGMTREELNQFLKYHPQEYQVRIDTVERMEIVRGAMMNVRTGGLAMRQEWQIQEVTYLSLKDGVVTGLSH